jgi:hypothetical protein
MSKRVSRRDSVLEDRDGAASVGGRRDENAADAPEPDHCHEVERVQWRRTREHDAAAREM